MRVITNKTLDFGSQLDPNGKVLGKVPQHTTIDLTENDARLLFANGSARPVPQPQVIFSRPSYETKVVVPRPFRDSDHADDGPALRMDSEGDSGMEKPNVAERVKGTVGRKRGRPRKSAK